MPALAWFSTGVATMGAGLSLASASAGAAAAVAPPHGTTTADIEPAVCSCTSAGSSNATTEESAGVPSSSTASGCVIAATDSAIRCKAAMSVSSKANEREENTNTAPSTTPSLTIGTAIAERKCRVLAMEARIRGSFSASSHSTT